MKSTVRNPTKSPKRKRSAQAIESMDTSIAAPVDPSAAPAPAESNAGSPSVALASNSTVKDAVALKDSLSAVANAAAAVVIDASGVERIDTATIQLLCAFVRERVAAQRSVVWQGSPPALLDAARLLGVQALLSLPQAESSGVAA